MALRSKALAFADVWSGFVGNLLMGSRSASANEGCISRTDRGNGVVQASMKKLLTSLTVLFCLPAMAATTYVSQSGGVFSGGTACNGHTAISVATFDASSPSPGDLIYLCGTLTSTVNVGTSGASGSVITVRFDAGARITLPVCNDATYGTVCLAIQNYTVVDGGSACGPGTACTTADSGTGIIEATNNGSGLTTQMCNTQGILAGGNNEIRNLIIRNIYQHTSFSDNACGGGDAAAFYSGNNGNALHDSTIHDAGTGWRGVSVPSNISFYNNNVYRYNWGFQQGTGGGLTASNYAIHDNHFGTTANWDDSNNTNHHNGVFFFDNSIAAGFFSGLYIYNNLFDGDRGCCSTSQIYFGGGQEQNTYVFNNVFNNGGQTNGLANDLVELTGEATQSVWVYNNTVIGAGTSIDNNPGIIMQGHYSAENNAVTGCGSFMADQGGTYGSGNPTTGTVDYNVYGVVAPSKLFQNYLGTSFTAMAPWQTYTGGETHSAYPGALSLNSDGSPQAGSPVIGVGVNLTNLCSGSLTALCSDTSAGGTRTPVARPTSGPWDAGAYQHSGTPAPPAAPTGLMSSVH